MRQVFEISRVARWKMWFGAVILVVDVALVVLFSLNVVSPDVASAQSPVKLVDISESTEIAFPKISFNTDGAMSFLKQREEQRRIAEEKAKAEAERASARAKANIPARNIVSNTNNASARPTCDRLIIPKIGLNACLATVGLEAGTNKVGVHPTLPAWFDQSSRAGLNNGRYRATFIDGHRAGIFTRLGSLAVGDTITVSFVSGEEYTYVVRHVETRSIDDSNLMRDALAIWGGAGYGLNLMTCDGAYDAARGTNVARIVVYATF